MTAEYGPGDIVNGHVLGADGVWHSIDTARVAPPPPPTGDSQAAAQALREWTSDAVRKGYHIESQMGDRVVVSKKKGIRPWDWFATLFSMAALGFVAVALFPPLLILVLIIPVMVVVSGNTSLRYELSVDDEGNVQQYKA